MTTENMKLAILQHFHTKLQYPLVVTEYTMNTEEGSIWNGYIADIFAIKSELMIEIEIKQHRWEIRNDLKTKERKHAFYLRTGRTWDEFHDEGGMYPNKFYFALPMSTKNLSKHKAEFFQELPAPYGLIAVYKESYRDYKDRYWCRVLKRARYLTKESNHLDETKERLAKKLSSENIVLRLKIKNLKRRNKDEN